MSPFTAIYVYLKWFLFIIQLRNMGLRNQLNMGLGDATGEVSECVRNALCTPVIVIHLLTPWSRVLLKKLIGFQLVKK